MEPANSTEEINDRLARVVEASKTDKKLREALLRDPDAVLTAHGIPLAPGLRIRFAEPNPGEIVLPLPKYEGPA